MGGSKIWKKSAGRWSNPWIIIHSAKYEFRGFDHPTPVFLLGLDAEFKCGQFEAY